MSNSKLISGTFISPNKNSPRNHSIDRITPHCYVAQASIESAGGWFAMPSAECSCNYMIGSDGRIGLIVDEKDRSWCSSSPDNDNRSVTFEVASDNFYPYAITDKAYESMIKLMADICQRNGKNKLLWFGDKSKTLAYQPKSNEMVITVHRWFAAKECPGEYIYSRLPQIVKEVNALLGAKEEKPKQDHDQEVFPDKKFIVQCGFFESASNASAMAIKLRNNGIDCIVKPKNKGYMIQCGALSSEDGAKALVGKLSKNSFMKKNGIHPFYYKE